MLLLLALMIPACYWQLRSRRKTLSHPRVDELKRLRQALSVKISYVPAALRSLTLILLILAAARPQSGSTQTKQKSSGIDIVLAIDTSGSMQALDFKIDGREQDRLQVVLRVLSKFIRERPNDRIGLVVFGTHAFAQAPLTLDHEVLISFVERLKIGMAGEATAIGDALGVAANRLKEIESKAKVIVLLTDGENTAGKLKPLEAAKAAAILGIKIYTIGVGSDRPVPIPTAFGYQRVRVPLDETLLKKIAKQGDGVYFNAQDTEGLFAVYERIDQLEKQEIETEVFYQYEEKYPAFLWLALLCLFLELGIRITRFRRIP